VAPARAPDPKSRRSWFVLLRLTLVIAATMLVLRVSGCTERLFYHPTREPTPAPNGWPAARVVHFDSRDGTKLVGWFIPAGGGAPGSGRPPSTSDSGPASGISVPTILHVHGNAGSMNSHLDFSSHFVAAGFNLFMFDFRGYGESEGSASNRTALIEDSIAAVDAMLAQPEVDPRRAGLFGQSLGGAIGLNVLARRNELRCAVLESPFSSWRLAAATALGGNEPGWFPRSLAALLIGDGARPIDALLDARVPILILHGTADTIVPVVHGRLLRDASPDRVTLREFEGGEHNSLGWSHPESRRLAVEFFRANLAPSTGP